MIKRLRRNFIIVNMLIVTVMLSVIFGLILFFTKADMEQENIQLLRSVSMMPKQHGRPDKLPEDRMPPSVFSVQQMRDGKYLAIGQEVVDFSDEALLETLYNAAQSAGSETGVLKAYGLRFHTAPSPMGKSVVFADISDEQKTFFRLARTCALIAGLSFGVFFFISILLAKWTVRPVETAWNQQKQFVADASHELKTPLTVIMTNAEMLLDGAHSEEKRMQFSESILTMSKQMKGLTESLLELARSDSNTERIVREDVDFSRLLSEAVLPFEPLYYERGLSIDAYIEDGIHISGSPQQLLRLIDILLDNAMKYSDPQSVVRLLLKRQCNACIFSVTSRGDTISKSDLKNIFRRFYRIDKARSMNHSYGLGLSIAVQIVHTHSGKIWAESADRTNIFSVKLPLES